MGNRPGHVTTRFRSKASARPPALEPEWQRWLAENLMLGVQPDAVAAALVERGCPPEIARVEIAQAEASPYFRASAVLRARLAKRDWQLKVASFHERLDGGEALARRDRLPGKLFLSTFYRPQRPVVLTGLFDHWPARGWTLERLAEIPGDPEIQVQQGRDGDPDYEINAHAHRQPMRLSAFLDRLRAGPSNAFYMTAGNEQVNRRALAELWDDVGDMPGYLRAEPGRDGFLWIGPEGTVTPWHHDLTNNLLIQMVGRKRVSLVSPAETVLMRNHRHCFSSFGGMADFSALPEGERPRVLTCDLGPGEALFIPLGWWHHVVGLDVTIGMSFTNFAWDNQVGFAGYTTYDQV